MKAFYQTKDQWYDYGNDLSAQMSITYIVVILHQQVFNGGFYQYFLNSWMRSESGVITRMEYSV